MAVNIKKEFWNGTEYKAISKIVFTSPNFPSPAVVGTRSHMQPGAKYMGTWYEAVDWMYRQKSTQDYTAYPSEMESFFGCMTLTNDFNFDTDINATVTHNYLSTYSVQPNIDYLYKDKDNYCKISSTSSFATSSGISIRFDYPTSTDKLFVNKANSVWWTCSGIGFRDKLDLYISYNGVTEICLASGITNTGKYSFVPTTTASGIAKLRLSYFDCYTVSSNSFSIVTETITPAVPATPSIPERLAEPEILFSPFVPAVPEVPAVPPPDSRLQTRKKVGAEYNNITEFIGPMFYDQESDSIYRFEAYGLFYFSKVDNAWLCLDPTPLGIGKGASILKVGRKIYVITGRIADTVTNQAGVIISDRRNLFLCYDMDVDEWIMLRPPPDAVQAVSDFLFTTSLYKFDNDDHIYYRTLFNGNFYLYKYNLYRDEWLEFCKFPPSKSLRQPDTADYQHINYGSIIFKYGDKFIVISDTVYSFTAPSYFSGSSQTIQLGNINSSGQYSVDASDMLLCETGLSNRDAVGSAIGFTLTECVAYSGCIILPSVIVDGTYNFLISRTIGVNSLTYKPFIGSVVLSSGSVTLVACDDYKFIIGSESFSTMQQSVADTKYFYTTQNGGNYMDRISVNQIDRLPGCNYHLRQGRLVSFGTKLYSVGFGYSSTMSVMDTNDTNALWYSTGKSPFAPVTDDKHVYLFAKKVGAPIIIPDYDNFNIYVMLDSNFMVFNTINNTWKDLTFTPFIVDDNFCGVKVGEFIYTLKGTDSSTCWKYDIVNDSWFVLHNFIAINIQYPIICYDRNDSYGNKTLELSAGKFDSTEVSADLNLLSPGTTYRYRLVGKDYTGQIFGKTFLFDTLPLVSTDDVSFVSSTAMTLCGTAYPHGIPTTCYFEYGTTASYGKVTDFVSFNTSEIVPLTATLSGLTPDTTYYYRTVGITQVGKSYGSGLITATLKYVISTAPNSLTPFSVNITGLIIPEPNNTFSHFHYGETAEYGYTTLSKPVLAGESRIISESLDGLVPNTIYHYCLARTTTSGTTYGSDMMFRTPYVITTEAVIDKTPFTATLSGIIRPCGVSTDYYFQYNKDDDLPTMTEYLTAPMEEVVKVYTTISGLIPNTEYNYRAVGVTVSGTTYGSMLKFKSSNFVTTGDVSSVTPFEALLHGSIKPVSSGTIGYFEYGLTSAYDKKTTAKELEFTDNVSLDEYIYDLKAGTTYHYRCVGTTISGVTASGITEYYYVYGDDEQFNTESAATVDSVFEVGPFTATLSGVVIPDQVFNTYKFEFGVNENYDYSTPLYDIDYADDMIIIEALNDLLPNTEYNCRLVGTTISGATISGSINSQTLSFYTEGDVNTDSVNDITYSTATISGRISTTAIDARGFFEYWAYPAYSGITAIQNISAGQNNIITATLSGLPSNSNCSYRSVLTTQSGIDATVSGTTISGCTYGRYKYFTTDGYVITDVCSYVGRTNALFAGRITSTVSGTVGYFEYGIYEYNYQTDYQEVSVGDYIPITATVSGLAPDTDYKYRAVITTWSGINATISGTTISGCTYGEDRYVSTTNYITTDLVSEVTALQATFNGRVTSVSGVVGRFEYGTDETYGNKTGYYTIGAGIDVPIEVTVSGLFAGAGYYYRLVGTTASGSTYGRSRMFSTHQPLYMENVYDITTSGAKVQGRMTPSRVSTGAYYEYGTTIDYGMQTDTEYITQAEPKTVVGNLIDLSPGTNYYYRLASDTSRYYYMYGTNVTEKIYSGSYAFTTPEIVKTGSAFDIAPDHATLSGTVTSYDYDPTCYFQFGNSVNYEYATPHQIVGKGEDQEVIAKLYTLTPDTIYHYRLVMATLSGVAYGRDMTVLTPSMIATGGVSNITPFRATLSGVVTPAEDMETTYQFQYGEVRDTLYAFNSYDPRIYKYSISNNDWTMVSGVLNDFMGQLMPWYMVDDGKIYLNSNNIDYYVESNKSHNVIKYTPETDVVSGFDLLPLGLVGAAYNVDNGLVYTASGIIDTSANTELYSYVLKYNLIPGIPAIPGTPAIPEVPYRAAISYSPEIPGTPEIPSYSDYYTQLSAPSGWSYSPAKTTGKRILNMNINFSEVVGSGIVHAGETMYHQYSNVSVSGTCNKPQTRWHHGENSIIFTCTFGEGYSCYLTAWDDDTHSTTNNKILAEEHYRVSAAAYRSSVNNVPHKPTFSNQHSLVFPPGNDVVLKGNEKYYGKFDLVFSITSGEYGEYLCFMPRMVDIDDSFIACAYDFVTTLHYQYT